MFSPQQKIKSYDLHGRITHSSLPANTTNSLNANKVHCQFPADVLLDIFTFLEVKNFSPIVLSSSKIHGIAFIRLERQQKLLRLDHEELVLQAEGINNNQNVLELAYQNDRGLKYYGWLPKENRDERIMHLKIRYAQLTRELNRIMKKLKNL